MLQLTVIYLLLALLLAAKYMQIPKRYNHLEVVGKGSYGMVCSAVDSMRNNAAVAIKKITPMAAHRYAIAPTAVIQQALDLTFRGLCNSVSLSPFPSFLPLSPKVRRLKMSYQRFFSRLYP